MTDEELIALLRERGGRIPTAAADRIEALVKERREDALELLAAHGQAQDAYEAQLKAEAEVSALQAEIVTLLEREEKLRGALEAAEAWIVDGGYLDDKDPYVAESAACVYGQTRAALTTEADNGLV